MGDVDVVDYDIVVDEVDNGFADCLLEGLVNFVSCCQLLLHVTVHCGHIA